MTALRDDEHGVAPAVVDAGFKELYRATYRGLLATAVATVRDRALAEDLVHDAYAQLWTQWSAVAQPAAWVRRAVVSNCLGALRSRRRREAILRRQPPPPTAATESEQEFFELLSGLNERQRIAITLRYLLDLPESEIAAALNCRPGTVKSTLHRAMQILRARREGEPS